jgi:threonine dehydrogenase-like Zn-dependent dehydrogenase
VPDELTDEQVLMCPDIMSTGFSGAENGNIRIGDTVAVFAQGPIGLCATAGAKLCGATTIIAVESVRAAATSRSGSEPTMSSTSVRSIPSTRSCADRRARRRRRLSRLGTQATFEGALRVLRPGVRSPASVCTSAT